MIGPTAQMSSCVQGRAVQSGEKPPVKADAPGVIASFSGLSYVLLCFVLSGGHGSDWPYTNYPSALVSQLLG